jgi:hypothetical protein
MQHPAPLSLGLGARNCILVFLLYFTLYVYTPCRCKRGGVLATSSRTRERFFSTLARSYISFIFHFSSFEPALAAARSTAMVVSARAINNRITENIAQPMQGN